MKSNKVLYSFALLSVSAALTFSACKKKDSSTTTQNPATTSTTPDTQSGEDSRNVQSENDNATNDVNNVLGNSRMGQRTAENASAQGVTGDICGLTVDSVNIASGVIKFTYTGVTCNNRTRTGSIMLTLQGATKWKTAGAVIKVDYIAYKVTRASDQKSVQFDGTQYLTNVSGGTWWDLLITKAKTSLITTVTGTNLKVTFEDNKTATYNINRRITYTYPASVITVMAEGIGTSGALSNLENYGTARNGDTFTSQVSTPIVWNTTCGGAVLQGVVSLTDVTKNLNLQFTYGVDANGNAQVVGPNACPYGWKLQWTANSTTNSKVFGYY